MRQKFAGFLPNCLRYVRDVTILPCIVALAGGCMVLQISGCSGGESQKTITIAAAGPLMSSGSVVKAGGEPGSSTRCTREGRRPPKALPDQRESAHRGSSHEFFLPALSLRIKECGPAAIMSKQRHPIDDWELSC